MKIINKTISLLRQKTTFGRPVRSERGEVTYTEKQEVAKETFIRNGLHDDALRRHKENKSMFVSLYWDKIFFNKEIKETRFLANEYDKYPFSDNGKKYPTRLHYYYEKGALSPSNRAKILEFQDMEKMRLFFEKIDKVSDWESMKYREKIMRAACEKQVAQNVHFMRRLAKTGDYTDFIFLNFQDGYFGTGADGKGYNKLGAILGDCRRMLTDKENNGFVLLFSAKEWVHPDKEFGGMMESVMDYVARQFPYVKKDVPNPVLNPGMVKTVEENIFDILKVINDVNNGYNETKFEKKFSEERVLKLKLSPIILEQLMNQKEERVR